MTSKFNDFRNKTLTQIRLWAWAAAVLPITALAGIFFVWRFFDGTILGIAMVTGEVIMFSIAVVWWWWAMYILRNLVKHWDETRVKVVHVLDEVKEMKSVVLEVFRKDDK